MSFTWPSLLGPVPLHDAVGLNCKKGTTTENHGSAVKYMG